MQVLLEGVAEHHDVSEVCNSKYPLEARQEAVQHPLLRRRSTRKPEWHTRPFIKTIRREERTVLTGVWVNAYLPIGLEQVETGKVSLAQQRIQSLVYAGKR